MSHVKDRIDAVLRRIEKACQSCGRDPKEIELLMVTKTVSPERIREALLAYPFAIGENRVQEAKAKTGELSDLNPKWHMIGQLQTNKVKDAIRFASMIQSVDRKSLVDELEKKLSSAGKKIDVLIQVNTSGEESKAGVDPEEADSLIQYAASQKSLNVRGLMTIGPNTDDAGEIRKSFQLLKEIGRRSSEAGHSSLNIYSMGMSGDMEIAIEEGSTMVRAGSAIFGNRPPVVQ